MTTQHSRRTSEHNNITLECITRKYIHASTNNRIHSVECITQPENRNTYINHFSTN